MQQYTAVIAAVGSALIVMTGYHFLVAVPALRRLVAAVQTHDALLGGGSGAAATGRLDALDARLRAAETAYGGVTAAIAALERVTKSDFTRVGFVRYNAFADVGSDQSYALALLTQEGRGVVLSSIYSREETRTYGKAVENFQTAQDASSEEKAAIAKARTS